MADSIIRLKVESSEYDSKIKRAAQGLAHMEEACRRLVERSLFSTTTRKNSFSRSEQWRLFLKMLAAE